jgi:adenylate cyclase
MFTDIVGYTAATQVDEKSALLLRQEQEALVRPSLVEHHGREVKSTGDGFLVEFESALQATECAIDIQRSLHDRNATPGARPLLLRIGIHLGDVEQRDSDIFGDAVNIAARIEPVAEPGGICLSGAVREQVWNKIPDRLERLPPRILKGIREETEIYRVLFSWSGPQSPGTLPSQTGLAVLPFANISPDPNDAYFADGLTEELITVLSQLRGLRVIARTSVMPYKATSKGVSQIGAELRVTSILEGSVRKSGNRLRVTVQLIDVRSEGHHWAQTYDRELDDVFAVQSDVARQVAEALKVALGPPEEHRLASRPTVRADSYLAYLQGRTYLHAHTLDSLGTAKRQFERAITLDPTNAAAHSGLAVATCMLGWWFPHSSNGPWLETGRGLAARALELDPNLAEAHEAVALILETDYDYAGAEREFRFALQLNPSYSLAHHNYASILEEEGRTEEALSELTLAEGADPLWTRNLWALAILLTWLGRPEEALLKIQRLRELEPEGLDYHQSLYHYYVSRSDRERALEELGHVEALQPDPRRKSLTRALNLTLSGRKEDARALLRHEEGLPELGVYSWWIGMVYAELGDLDRCFPLLEKGANTGYVGFQALRVDPRLAHVRSDPRFQALWTKTVKVA